MFLAGLYHSRMLPPGAKAVDAPKSFGDAMKTFGHAFVTFFQKKDVCRMIAFAFLYRFGYGLLDKMGPLFMIDSRANGGLGLSQPGRRRRQRHVRHAARSSSGRCSAACSCRARASRRRC